MKAKREQEEDILTVIKLFVSNYARDLIYNLNFYFFDNITKKVKINS